MENWTEKVWPWLKAPAETVHRMSPGYLGEEILSRQHAILSRTGVD